MIFLSIILFSCQKIKYPWEPGISAPKYYPVAGSISFGSAGYSSNTAFANGWGNEYGGVVSGDKYKEIPKKVSIDYYSVVDGKDFRGTVSLEQDKILDLFRKYNINDKNFAHLVVGMAPGGWVRVWFKTLDEQIEISKAQLKGYRNDNVGIGLKTKNFEHWGNTYTYWQHHGIPYKAWAENEKEYYYNVKFISKNKDAKLDRSYIVSADGWYSSFYTEKRSDDITDISNNGFMGKIPVHLSASWQDKITKQYYDTNIVMPKTLKELFNKTYVADEKHTFSNFIIELENDKHYAIVYLKTKDKTIKLLRFKGELSTKENQDFGDYNYAKEIEYFIP